MAEDVVSTAQKREGTFREHLGVLRLEFSELLQMGAGAQDYETILLRLLKGFEEQRIKTEATARTLRRQLSFVEAEARAAITHSNLIVSLVQGYKEEAKQAQQRADVGEPKTFEPVDEFYQTHCACACQDEEDEKECDCPCHQGEPCDVDWCVPCSELKGVEPKPRVPSVREGVE